MVLQPVPRDGAPAHAAWRAWWRVSLAPRPTTTVPAADLAGRPDLIERNFTADAAARKLVGNITHTPLTQEGFVYPAGRDETTLLEENCWLRHGGTHANRIGPKRSAKLAVRECRPIKGVTIFHSNRGSQYTSADYTATMNKYGFLASAGRTGVCHVQRRSRYHSTPPVQERTRQPAGSTTPEEKQSKIVVSWIEH